MIIERKTLAKAFFNGSKVNQERKLEDRRRSDTVVVLTVNDDDKGWEEGVVVKDDSAWRPKMKMRNVWPLGGVFSQGRNLKELTERHHQVWSLRLNLTQRGKTYQVQTVGGFTDWEIFKDLLGGGAWPFLVRDVNCLVNSDNERDEGGDIKKRKEIFF